MIAYSTISLPTPFPVGPINVYLIKNDPITLIDCGPYTLEAKKALAEQLDNLGLKLEDIKRIIITHAHPDHFGLSAELQRISGASILMHRKEVAKALDRFQHVQRITSYLAYAGMPDVTCEDLLAYFRQEVLFVQSPKEIIEVEDRHIFPFDGLELQGVLIPGHSIGHLGLFRKEERLLFAGDTMLEKITPNPVLEPLPDQSFCREKSMSQYLNSLNFLKQLEIKRICTGHGKPIEDVGMALWKMENHHQMRIEEVGVIAAQRKVFNPFELAVLQYPNLSKPVDVYLAMSEILGVLDLLEAEGKVMQQPTSKLTYTWN